jgi:hypothetical protein
VHTDSSLKLAEASVGTCRGDLVKDFLSFDASSGRASRARASRDESAALPIAAAVESIIEEGFVL